MLLCYTVTRLDFPSDLEAVWFGYGLSVLALGPCVGKLAPRVALRDPGYCSLSELL